MHYHDLARWLFITLTFAGLLSTGWFGIPRIPEYFLNKEVNILYSLFTLFSALGTVWGVMAYREFTRSSTIIVEARIAARELDPLIGNYEYKSFNPLTREYDSGFIPQGPIDFWDKETHVPSWMDKGKYWHVLVKLQEVNRDVRLQVVKDNELPFSTGPRNAALMEKMESGMARPRYYYVVKIPQWIVMTTEKTRFEALPSTGSETGTTATTLSGSAAVTGSDAELNAKIANVNKLIVAASDEIAWWEAQRVKFPWKFVGTLRVYLNKSLPIRIVYNQVLHNLPGAKRKLISEVNLDLADVRNDDLIATLLLLAEEKGISSERLEMTKMLIRYLKNSYTRLALGEGASEYHSLHHSLEVSYMALHMLPRSFRGYSFGPKDFEALLVAALLHDYDPEQAKGGSKSDLPKGPSVIRTMAELERTKIIEAYFILSPDEFENYFREYSSSPTKPPIEYSTTHPEMVTAVEEKHNKNLGPLAEPKVAKALIWRTDFPYFKQKHAQQMFSGIITELSMQGVDADRLTLLGEVLRLADLAVTYMGSAPLRAWDRVNNLYEELNLPRVDALIRTDAFFRDFANNPIFQDIIKMRHFPAIFRQRWLLVYRFFHEGNPSTQINETIKRARKSYSKVNVELGMRRGELLQVIAANNWSEYFIGIGKDQAEVFKAKSRLGELESQNAAAYWGDTEKLLPSIDEKSIDNFLIVLPEHAAQLFSAEQKESFKSAILAIKRNLVTGGSIRILTDIQHEGQSAKELEDVVGSAGFTILPTLGGKRYFPEDWTDRDFQKDKPPRVLILVSKDNATLLPPTTS